MEIILLSVLIFLCVVIVISIIYVAVISHKKQNTGELDMILNALKDVMDSTTKSTTATVANAKEVIITANAQTNNAMLSAFDLATNKTTQSIRDFMTNQQNSSQELKTYIQSFNGIVEEKLKAMQLQLNQSLTEVRDDNAKQLEKMRETVDEKLSATLNDRISKSFSVISDKLMEVAKNLGEMKQLADGVTNLNKVLNNVKTRGTWGEVALQSLLEQILNAEQYKMQERITGTKEAVDFAIILPGQADETVYLPIDCKFPLADYEMLVDASEVGDLIKVNIASKALENAVKTQAKSIAEKYIYPPKTTDFAIMYLPIEGLFAEVVKRAGLCDELQTKYHIVLCGPTTIAALLNSLQMGFRTLAIQKGSSNIYKLLSSFKTEFGKYAELLSKAQQQVNTVSKSLETASKKTAKIQKQLSKVETENYDLQIEDDVTGVFEDSVGEDNLLESNEDNPEE
ncbi:MAG: DNA recombination protein RmuC [Clostridia bacterium]